MDLINKHKFLRQNVALEKVNDIVSDTLGFVANLLRQHDISHDSLKLDFYHRMASSNHLQEVYLQRKHDYVSPHMYIIKTPCEKEFNYVYTPIRNLIYNFVKSNPWIVNALDEEKVRRQSSINDHTCFSSIMDGFISDRLIGKLKIELFLGG